VAVSGEVGWPPLGNSRWPLTPCRHPRRQRRRLPLHDSAQATRRWPPSQHLSPASAAIASRPERARDHRLSTRSQPREKQQHLPADRQVVGTGSC